MREEKIETYLKRRVKELGGETRKVKWIGRRGAPDELVLLEDRPPSLVELKAPGLDAEDHQHREHKRLRKYNFPVVVLDTKEKIDHWLSTGEVCG